MSPRGSASLSSPNSVTFSVEGGEALGVVGPNGAGKTSLLSLIGGLLKPDSGSIRFDGRDITSLSQQARCRAGVARTHQIPRPFEKLTVFENVLVGGCFGRRSQRTRGGATLRGDS